MPKSIPRNRRRWVAAWAVLCGAGIAATAQLNASSAPDPEPENPVSAQCATVIADIERQLAKTRREGWNGRILTFSRIRSATEDDCHDEIRDHFRGDK